MDTATSVSDHNIRDHKFHCKLGGLIEKNHKLLDLLFTKYQPSKITMYKVLYNFDCKMANAA